MKCFYASLISLAILFTAALSAPVERSEGVVLHHIPSRHGHRGLSHRIRAAATKRLSNLTFAPADSVNDFIRVEHGASQTTDSRITATLFKLGRDAKIADADSGGDAQTVIHVPDIYEGRHVTISIADSLVWGLQQRGMSQDDIPNYVRQNVHVTDSSTGNQYQLVPGDELVSNDSNAITITLRLN